MQDYPRNSAERAIFAKFQASKFENSEPEKCNSILPAIPYPHQTPSKFAMNVVDWETQRSSLSWAPRDWDANGGQQALENDRNYSSFVIGKPAPGPLFKAGVGMP